ncbi:MAG: sugar ABC transporter permease [Lentisphaerae bacterium]|nr:sugar ABC transporter permease [Lentisphaerota bacterium]
MARNRSAPYVFLAPFFLVFLLFWIWPILFSGFLSLTRWGGMGRPEFVGLRNFVSAGEAHLSLANDAVFHGTVRNTFCIAAGSVFLIMPAALGLAVLLNNPVIRMRNSMRLGIFLPLSLSLVVVSLIFIQLLDHNAGILRYWLGRVGIGLPDLLSSETLAMPTLIGILLWRWTGYNMLFFLAGLQSIPAQVIEAARIDGASRRQLFFHVTLPMLKPVTIFVMMQALIGAFQVFEEPLIIFGGGPANSTRTMALYLYERAFRSLRFGYASSVAVVQFVLILVLSLLALRLTGAFRKE